MGRTVQLVGGSSRADVNSGSTMRKESDILVAGDFRLDVAGRIAFLRKKKLELAAAEFDLLVYLVSHPKRMVTGQTMLSTRWGDHQVQQTPFLQVLLSLRRKLETAGAASHYLRTEPLVVYRFDPLGD